jgi:DNA-binding NarL/FixJ family response regulator
MIRILLIDDHAVVRAGYRRFLEHSGGIEVVAEAADAQAGYAAFIEHQPDVSVVDISLAGASGLDLIHRMIQREPSARVLAFSMHEDAMFARRALQSGARAYVTKASDPQTLVDAVRSVHNGQMFLSADVAQRMPRTTHHSADHDPFTDLSAKEFEVFRLLAQGMTAAQIAASLNLSLKTVANYQTAIKDKLAVNTTAALVHVALKHGVITTLS